MMNTPGWTIREIAEEQGLTVHTVMYHRGQEPLLWASWEVGVRPQPGRGRPEKLYDPVEVAAHYRAKAKASKHGRPGPKRDRGRYDRDEVVGWAVIGKRLDINADTARGYPSRYARGDNPFPAHVDEGRYRWGDIEDWDDRRRGSGRRTSRAPEDGVPAQAARAHLADLERQDAGVAGISAATGVPMRTLRRISTGDLAEIHADYEQTILAATVEECLRP
jgi:hypothetical protein